MLLALGQGRPMGRCSRMGPCAFVYLQANPPGHFLLFFFLPVRDNLQGTNTCTAECTGRTSPEALPRELLHVFQRAQCKPGTGLEPFPLHFASSITKLRGGIQPTKGRNTAYGHPIPPLCIHWLNSKSSVLLDCSKLPYLSGRPWGRTRFWWSRMRFVATASTNTPDN